MPEEKGGELGGDFLAGGSEMGKRIPTSTGRPLRLGPLPDWPQSMRLSVSLCVKSSFPIIIHWGWRCLFPPWRLKALDRESFQQFCSKVGPFMLTFLSFRSLKRVVLSRGP